MLDVFNSDAFSEMALAAAVAHLPHRPTRLGPASAGGLGLFEEEAIATVSLVVEEEQGRLVLIPTSGRGAPGDTLGRNRRVARSFTAQHLRRTDKVMADEVQGVRMFGQETGAEALEAVRDKKLRNLQWQHEATWEYHRIGALKGEILDADGTTTLYNLFTEFGVSQQTQDFVFTDADTDVRAVCISVARAIESVLGGTAYQRLHAFCSSTFFDALVGHASVKGALQYLEGRMLLEDLRKGFTIGPITFEEYRGSVVNPAGTAVDFIAANTAYVFPVGGLTPEGPLFIGRFAPQPFLNTVNRLNPPLVVMPVIDPAMQYIELIGISCPLYLCTRPRAVIKCTMS